MSLMLTNVTAAQALIAIAIIRNTIATIPNTSYLPGTVLSTLNIESPLILTPTTALKGRYCNHHLPKRNLRVRKNK